MTTLPRDPLTGTDRLLIDGTNLLHALSRKPGAAPQAALIGRLRAIVPASIGIELVFDGVPDPGMRGERVASGLIVRHAGRRSADEVLLSLVDETRAVAGAAAAGDSRPTGTTAWAARAGPAATPTRPSWRPWPAATPGVRGRR